MAKILWYAIHITAILVHVGLLAVSAYGFVSCGTRSIQEWEKQCDSVVLPAVSFGVGVVITLFNIIYPVGFLLLAKFIKKSDSRRTKSRVLLIIGIVVNGIFAAADVAIAVITGVTAVALNPFIGILVFAAVGALVLILTIVADVFQVKELPRREEHVKGSEEYQMGPSSNPQASPQTMDFPPPPQQTV